MMRRAGLLAVLLSLGILVPDRAQGSEVRPFVDFEAGPAFPGYNDVRIPGDGGTTFSLTQQLKAPVAPYFRARAGVRIGRHEIFAFFAPLTIRPTGTVPYDVLFVDAVFPANTFLDATWTFDTYRLTYRYSIVDDETLAGRRRRDRLGPRGVDLPLRRRPLPGEEQRRGRAPVELQGGLDVRRTLGDPPRRGRARGPPGARRGRVPRDSLPLRRCRQRPRRVSHPRGRGDNSSVYNFALVNFLAFGFDVTL